MSSDDFTIPLHFNPAATSNPEVFYQEAFSILMKKLEITCPGKIEAYNRKTHIARIRPMLKIRYTNGKIVEAEPITVEIYRMAAGGFVIDFPIKEGDTGWFVSSDRDVSAIKESGELGLPSSVEVHSFKRGFWIPDMWGELELGENTENCLTIQATDGSSKIVIGKGTVEVTTSTSISATAPSVSLDTSTISMKGDVTIDGNLKIKTGTITTKDNIILDTHQHPTAALGNPSGPENAPTQSKGN